MASAIGILAATLVIVVWKGPQVIPDFVRLTLNEVYPSDVRIRWSPIEWFGLPGWVAYASATAIAVAAFWRASFSLATIAMLVAVPALHAHYLTWLLVPALCIWIPWALGRRGRLVPSGR